MQIPFTKMHGLGNDFVVLDEREHAYGLSRVQMRVLADRRFGVGCDQILVLSPSQLADTAARYSIFNADGSAAEHCGNGIRCIARYMRDHDTLETSLIYVEIDGARFELKINADASVRVDMGRPNFEPAAIPIARSKPASHYRLSLGEREIEFGSVSMGNPHAVMLVEDVDNAPVETVGVALQSHTFFPARVNVGFMQIIDRATIKLRVFERGVGETMACGTGACAALAVGRSWGMLDESVAANLSGGELRLQWSGREDESLWMTGPAESVFAGIIDL